MGTGARIGVIPMQTKFWHFGALSFVCVLLVLEIGYLTHGTHYPILIGLAVTIAASWILSRNTLYDIGLAPKNSREEIIRFLLWFLLAEFCVVSVAIGSNPRFTLSVSDLGKLGIQIVEYYPWAFIQQLVLGGFVVTRLERIVPDKTRIPLWTGLIFSALHTPNVVLMAVCMGGGALSAKFFISGYRNVYLLALLHATLGATVRHGFGIPMQVGLGYNFWF